MYQCILNVPLWNDSSKVTHSQVHGSPVLKALLLQSFQWISVTRHRAHTVLARSKM